MIPCIKKEYQNVVISTGNIINNELGQRKSNEELYDGLKITLHSDPNVERVVVEIDELHGRVQHATEELTNRLTENQRSEISIGAKIFLNNNSTVFIEQAVDTLLNILNVTHVDNVVLAYHPNASGTTSPVANATAKSTTAAPAVKSPCSEANLAPSSVSNWSARNGAQGVIELKELYRSLEQYALNQKITQLGIADLDAEALAELHKSAAVAPTIAQVNLSTCCRVPTELQEFCAAHDIQLNTHGDPELLLPEEQFSGLAPGYTIDWSLRYQVHVRCRGVLTAKGYIVGASQPIPSASTSAKASA
ncbi:glutamate--cysteine ligase regulatory subunit [Drosophila pseudoobscura]|uniref:GCS light chain n=1 Tax=Drosophila pseudoobscura pseudoobscura TaxID=46245 RepID=A0A6I8UP82_DROPS|nr:glutamate--cysteine ligase regulatory subunit [Drosophila pseudoobscura]